MTSAAGPQSTAERYHAATDYTPERLARPAPVDVAAQPSPFKSWYQAERVPLAGGARGPWVDSPGALDLERLGSLLFHAYGVTRLVQQPGGPFAMRAAPSAGGLYPAELYVAAQGIPGLSDGLYDYQAREHALALCWEGDFLPQLARFAYGHPAFEGARVVLVASGVWQRSAWRYGDRAYRRVLLDTGHMLENAVLAGHALGAHVVPLAGFHDDAVDGLLLLDAATEGTLALAPVLERVPAPEQRPEPCAPTALAAEEAPASAWLRTMHDAARLPADVRFSPRRPAPVVALDPLEDVGLVPLQTERCPSGPALLEAIRRRRSTRRFSGGAIGLEQAGRILAHAQPSARDGELDTLPAADVLLTSVVASALDDVESGIYRYDPLRHELRGPLRSGDPRRALWHCCLQQDLGRDAAFAVVHSLPLAAAVERYGERAYRHAHLAAGMIGQRLSLAALRLGLGASGIGGFLDHVLAELLALPAGHVVAYLTVFGRPA